MGDGAADEHQTRVAPRLEAIIEHRRQDMAALPIPDELLAEILLRLPTTADLARASAACVSFRRVAADRPFLEEGRAKRKIFHPAVPPYPSAPEASAASIAADFSFSFLPAPASDWALRDTRDGRVLLDRPTPGGHSSTVVFPEVVVCDPLHRRYLLLPPISYDLAASVKDPLLSKTKRLRVQIFLVPTGDGEKAGTADETSFRVIWMAQCKTMLVTFVFSSNTRQWQALPSQRWSDLSAGLPPFAATTLFYSRRYVYDCFYWATPRAYSQERKLLVLDVKTMGFSIAKAPPEANSCCDFCMVEAGEGRLGMLVIAYRGFDLSYLIRQNDGQNQWQKVKTISLSSWAVFICNMEKYVLLYRGESSLLEDGCFMLDIGTFQLEKVCAFGSTFVKLRAYSNFPPSLLSSPTISSGFGNGPEKEMLEQGCAASSSADAARSE